MKKNNVKKYLSLIFSVIMLFSCFNIGCYATEIIDNPDSTENVLNNYDFHIIQTENSGIIKVDIYNRDLILESDELSIDCKIFPVTVSRYYSSAISKVETNNPFGLGWTYENLVKISYDSVKDNYILKAYNKDYIFADHEDKGVYCYYYLQDYDFENNEKNIYIRINKQYDKNELSKAVLFQDKFMRFFHNGYMSTQKDSPYPYSKKVYVNENNRVLYINDGANHFYHFGYENNYSYNSNVYAKYDGQPVKIGGINYRVDYTYEQVDEGYLLKTRKQSNDLLTQYSYNSENQITQIKDPCGINYDIDYDSNGKVVSISDGRETICFSDWGNTGVRVWDNFGNTQYFKISENEITQERRTKTGDFCANKIGSVISENLISNGDFSNSLVGWSLVEDQNGTAVIDNEKYKIVSYENSNVSTNYQVTRTDNVALYMLCFDIYGLCSNNCTDFALQLKYSIGENEYNISTLSEKADSYWEIPISLCEAAKENADKIIVSFKVSNGLTVSIDNLELFELESTDSQITDEDDSTDNEDTTDCCNCPKCTEEQCSCRCIQNGTECNCESCERGLKEVYNSETGILESFSIGDTTLKKEEFYNYTDSGAYLTSTILDDGTQIEEVNDQSNGTLIKEGINGSNYTEYYYDKTGNVSQITTDVLGVTGNSEVTTSFEYSLGKISGINHNGFLYAINYDSNLNLKNIKIGNKQLVEYKYHNDKMNTLSEIVYGNGKRIRYDVYDNGDLKNVYLDGNTSPVYEYTFDNENMLKTVRDNLSGYLSICGENYYTVKNSSGNVLYHIEYQNNNNNGVNYVEQNLGITINSQSSVTKNDETGNTQYITNFNNSFGESIHCIENKNYFGDILQKTITSSNETSGTSSSISYQYIYDKSNYNSQTGITESNLPQGIVKRVTVLQNAFDNEANKFPAKYIYDYDCCGNIVKQVIKNTQTDAIYATYTYIYDEADQLTRCNDSLKGITTIYSYDSGGNIISIKTYSYTEEENLSGLYYTQKTFSYSDSQWRDKLTKVGDSTIEYDDIGNVIEINGASLEWNAGRQLKRFTWENGGVYEYKYNDENLRTQQKINIGGGDLTYNYVWSNGRLVSIDANSGELNLNAVFIYDNNEVIGLTYCGKTYLYQKDFLGNVIAILDENSIPVMTFSYNSLGEFTRKKIRSGYNNLFYINPFYFHGYMYDAYSEMYYLKSRYYSPYWGRFINADDPQFLLKNPESAVSYNLFAYCSNDFINNTDPTGYWGKNIHYGSSAGEIKGTYGWALDCGFTKDQAKKIASANKSMDININTNPFVPWGQKYHFNRSYDYKNNDSRKIEGKKYLELAKKKRKKNSESSLKYLGKALHCYQDIEAHGNISYGPWYKDIKRLSGHYSMKYADNVYYEWSTKDRFSVKKGTVLSKRYYATKSITYSILKEYLRAK